jgi:hypothetical protein
MAEAEWYPKEIIAFRARLKVNHPYLSSSLQEVLDAEEQHHRHAHILYTIIIAAFNAGREYQWKNPTADPYQDG